MSYYKSTERQFHLEELLFKKKKKTKTKKQKKKGRGEIRIKEMKNCLKW